MNDNPYQSPETTSDDPRNSRQADTTTTQRDVDGLRVVGRIAVGFFGGAFAGVTFWVAIVYWTGQWMVAELVFIPAWIGFAIVAGWTAYSAIAPIRVVAWAFAGLGAGLTLEAILAGGLEVGTWLTFSGVVLGLLFAVLGYRRDPRPKRPQTKGPDSEEAK